MYLIFIILQFHLIIFFFFFNDTATTEIYTLSLHDALPISALCRWCGLHHQHHDGFRGAEQPRSEEHTSELQSRLHLVCRLLLEKKKKHIRSLHRTILQSDSRNISSR